LSPGILTTWSWSLKRLQTTSSARSMDLINEKIQISHTLLTKANLSHSRLTKFVENLTGAGLINKIEYDGKNTFVITAKGRQYLESYKQFSNLAGSFGLEL